MVKFSNEHKAVVLTENDYQSFVVWALDNGVSFQEVKTEDDANELHTWLPSTEVEEWEPSSEWDSSGC